MSGFPTNQGLLGATPFVYHVSDHVYVDLMQDLSLSETLIAKEAMEKVMAQTGRSIQNYNANNCRFVDNGFVDAVNSKSQKPTFCEVGAHHQNGKILNKNKVLTTGVQKLLFHGIKMWPQMIDDMSWPFAIKYVAKRLNSLKLDILGRTPESILHGVEVQEIPVNYYHILFFSTYVLYVRLQSDGGAGPPKLELRL